MVVSLSRIKFDPNTYVYSPRCDLGIGEEWLPKFPVIKPQMAIQPTWMRYDGDDDNDEFQCSFGAINDPQYEESIASY